MSYETTNSLPGGVTKKQAAEFALMLGYRRAGTYAHLGMPDVISMLYFDETDYRSWETVELSIGSSESDGHTYVNTRTRVGRSHYDFEMQNRTVRKFKQRFGGTSSRDGGNGDGYDPGPPIPPAASGSYLAMLRFDWNLSRVDRYLHVSAPQAGFPAEEIWPQLRQLNPDVFISNVLMTYLVSAMEDYFKSTYVVLLTYSDRKATVLKNARLSGEQLAQISAGALTVEKAVAETLPFQRLAAVGRHFRELDQTLDLLAPLKRPYRRRKVDLLTRLETLVTQRHALIHGMHIDIELDREVLDGYIHDLTIGMGRIYAELCAHHGWRADFSMLNNDYGQSRRSRSKARA